MSTEELIIKELKGASEPLLAEILALIKRRKGTEASAIDSALMSEPILAKDWSSPEEDEAWQHL